MSRVYIGDGVYASDEGFQFCLRTDDDEIYLDDSTLDSFLRFIERAKGIKFTVSQAEEVES